jgi:hypothetical protein
MTFSAVAPKPIDEFSSNLDHKPRQGVFYPEPKGHLNPMAGSRRNDDVVTLKKHPVPIFRCC